MTKPLPAIATSMLALAICATAFANPSNKWRLYFSGDARTDGVIKLKFSPVGGDSFTVAVDVPDNTSENLVTKIVVEMLKEKLPSDGYHVERDDGEDVLIRARHGAAHFDLTI